MTLETIQRVISDECSDFPVMEEISDKSTMFRDNIEHLEALEYIARVRLAIAYLRSQKAGHNTKTISSSFHSAEGKSVLGKPKFGFSDLSSDNVTINELEALLARVENTTQQRARNALKQGIELHFEHFCKSYELDESERSVVMLFLVNNTSKSFRTLYEQCEIIPMTGRTGA